MFHFNFLDRKVGRPSSLELQQQQQQYHSGAAVKATSDQGAGLDYGGDSSMTVCVVMITPIVIVCANAGDSRVIFAQQNPRAANTSSTNISNTTNTTPTTNNTTTTTTTTTVTNKNTTTRVLPIRQIRI